VNKINDVISSNKLKNNFAGPVTTGLGPDVACGSPVATRQFIQNTACTSTTTATLFNIILRFASPRMSHRKRHLNNPAQ